MLADSPMIGTARLAKRPNLRVFPVSSHVIIYEPREGGIDVIRVLHARRDWMGMLGD